MKWLHRMTPVLVLLLIAAMLPLPASAVMRRTVVDIACGENHTVVLYNDGLVAAVGDNSYKQCDVYEWRDIVAISTLSNHTVGLRSDGTVVATGDNEYGQCNVYDWTDIIEISAGGHHTLGLRSDGTAIAVGRNDSRQCDVGSWKDIQHVAAALTNSLGLAGNGDVIIRGTFTKQDNFYIGGLKRMTTLTAGTGYFAGLDGNGIPKGVGNNTDPDGKGFYQDIHVDSWGPVQQIAVGRCNAFGLTKSGKVLASGRNDFGQMNEVSGWKDVIRISAGFNHVAAICSDGTLLAAGDRTGGKCDLSSLQILKIS